MILKDELLAEDVYLEEIAEKSVDFSGSDLHELCRCAAMNSFIQTLKKCRTNDNLAKETQLESVSSENSNDSAHFIRKIDFEVAFEKMSVKNLTKKNRFDFTTAKGYF